MQVSKLICDFDLNTNSKLGQLNFEQVDSAFSRLHIYFLLKIRSDRLMKAKHVVEVHQVAWLDVLE